MHGRPHLHLLCMISVDIHKKKRHGKHQKGVIVTKIVIDPDSLNEAANEMLFVLNVLKTNRRQIEALVLSTGDDWKGAAEKAFEDKLVFIQKEYEKLFSFFEQCAQLLSQCATDYTCNEKDLLSKLNCI